MCPWLCVCGCLGFRFSGRFGRCRCPVRKSKLWRSRSPQYQSQLPCLAATCHCVRHSWDCQDWLWDRTYWWVKWGSRATSFGAVENDWMALILFVMYSSSQLFFFFLAWIKFCVVLMARIITKESYWNVAMLHLLSPHSFRVTDTTVWNMRQLKVNKDNTCTSLVYFLVVLCKI